MDNTSVIEINGKNYVMTFGMGFLEKLNSKYTVTTSEGLELRNGIAQALMDIGAGNAAIFYDMILFSTANLQKKPSPVEVEKYVLEKIDDEEESEAMTADFLECLKKVPGWKAFEKKLKKAIEEEPEEETETEAEAEE